MVKLFRYYFEVRAQLDRFIDERRQLWLRRDVPAGHLELINPQFHETSPQSFEVAWTMRLSSKFGSYGRFNDVPEELLVELHDMIGKLLKLEPQPLQVKLSVEQPKPKKRAKRIVSPAQALEDASEVALTPEERAIHRRMLEGR